MTLLCCSALNTDKENGKKQFLSFPYITKTQVIKLHVTLNKSKVLRKKETYLINNTFITSTVKTFFSK